MRCITQCDYGKICFTYSFFKLIIIVNQNGFLVALKLPEKEI